jgi:ABC-type phosphate/phosphonate transport system permease subunit
LKQVQRRVEDHANAAGADQPVATILLAIFVAVILAEIVVTLVRRRIL